MPDYESTTVEAAAHLALQHELPAERERPTGEDLAPPRWPTCRYCGVEARPGRKCGAKRCPWQRDQFGVIATMLTG